VIERVAAKPKYRCHRAGEEKHDKQNPPTKLSSLHVAERPR